MKKEGIVRKRILVFGRVQGVGFRYRASHAAKAFGKFQNMLADYPADGSVEMELQGEEELIRRMEPAMEDCSWIRIMEWKMTDLPVDEEERSFYVRG